MICGWTGLFLAVTRSQAVRCLLTRGGGFGAPRKALAVLEEPQERNRVIGVRLRSERLRGGLLAAVVVVHEGQWLRWRPCPVCGRGTLCEDRCGVRGGV